MKKGKVSFPKSVIFNYIYKERRYSGSMKFSTKLKWRYRDMKRERLINFPLSFFRSICATISKGV